MKVYKDADIDQGLIKQGRVAIIGYGNQAHAHAQNLADSGVDVVVGLREGSARADAARAAGLIVQSIEDAARTADVVMMLIPDEVQGHVYRDHLHVNMKKGACLGFAHGLAIRFNLVEPRDDIRPIMIAPKGPGHTLRTLYKDGLGMPCLVASANDEDGSAFQTALSYAAAIGGGRAGVLPSSFAEECETDLFSEQVVLCGGLPGLVKNAFEVLVARGYTPEVAYIECLHEVKQIADLMWEGGLDYMHNSISNTAEYGGYLADERIVSPAVRAEMEAVLDDVQNGRFVKALLDDIEGGGHDLKARRAHDKEHPIEEAGRNVRGMMGWLKS
ncbi:MAG: ketol-acid reductoisomerase [Sphingomonadales bacterium]|nr:ketol-acid reductoisomerase [Sphingomonadales bacterium]